MDVIYNISQVKDFSYFKHAYNVTWLDTPFLYVNYWFIDAAMELNIKIWWTRVMKWTDKSIVYYYYY